MHEQKRHTARRGPTRILQQPSLITLGVGTAIALWYVCGKDPDYVWSVLLDGDGVFVVVVGCCPKPVAERRELRNRLCDWWLGCGRHRLTWALWGWTVLLSSFISFIFLGRRARGRSGGRGLGWVGLGLGSVALRKDYYVRIGQPWRWLWDVFSLI